MSVLDIINHILFLSEGYNNKCSNCSRDICYCCQFKTLSKEIVCSECLNINDIEQTEENNSNIIDVPVTDMITQLTSLGVNLRNTDDYACILGIYNEVIINKNRVFDETMLDKIYFPIQEPSYLLELESVSDFQMKNGSQFVMNNLLTELDRINLLDLLSELIYINDNNPIEYNERTYLVVPNIIINFATNSRCGSGYRLLKRCLRHGLDPDNKSIRECNGSVIKYNNNIGLLLCHTIKASMNNREYKVKVAFTKTEMICCSCTCPAKIYNKGLVMCVHILPVLYQLVIYMKQYLAQHILFDYSTHFKTINQQDIPTPMITLLRKSIQQLKVLTEYYEISDQHANLDKLLECFSVGTDKAKKPPRPPEDRKKLIPLRNLNLESVYKKAKKILSNTSSTTQINEANNIMSVNIEDYDNGIVDLPNIVHDESVITNGYISTEIQSNPQYNFMTQQEYINVCKMISCFCRIYDKSDKTFISKLVGYKLLSMRADYNFNNYKIDYNKLKK